MEKNNGKRIIKSDSMKMGSIHIDNELEPLDITDAREKAAFILISYYYFSGKNAVRNVHNQFNNKKVHLMMDSGVFTYRKHGSDVSIDKYIDFLNNNADLIEYAVTLDYPHSAKEIIKNTDYIQERLDPKIKLVPVIQSFIFDKSESEYFLSNDQWPLVCLGTYNGKNSAIMYCQEVQNSLKPIYELNKKYKRILHGLGRTRLNWLLTNPVDSSDSSAWARYLITGNTVCWDPDTKNTISFAEKEHRFMLLQFAEYYEKRFNIAENDMADMVVNAKNLYADTYPHSVLCILTYILMQEEIRKKHPNYRQWQATSNAVNFRSMDQALDLYYNRNY